MSIEVPLGRDVNLRFVILELNEDVLRVGYQAENVSDSDLYVFNRLYRDVSDEGVFNLDPNLVYIYVEDGVVHLTKRIADIPLGILVEIPIVPCVTLLPHGERLSETLSLKLPLRSFDPYQPETEATIASIDSLAFSLGYFKVSEIGARPVNEVQTTEGRALYAYVTPWDQLVVRTAPIGMSKPAPSEAAAEGRLECPQCGTANPPGSRFCSHCGNKLVS